MNAFTALDRWTARMRDAALKAGKRKLKGWVKAHMRKGKPVKAHSRKTAAPAKRTPAKKAPVAPTKKRTPAKRKPTPSPLGAAMQAHLDRQWRETRPADQRHIGSDGEDHGW